MSSLLLLLLPSIALGLHILVLHPFYAGSHVLTLHTVTTALLHRGHSVTTVKVITFLQHQLCAYKK